jgi:hypothetical protein
VVWPLTRELVIDFAGRMTASEEDEAERFRVNAIVWLWEGKRFADSPDVDAIEAEDGGVEAAKLSVEELAPEAS